MDAKEILRELSSLPKGYLSHKKIKGIEYVYWQRQENGKLLSKYVKKSELPLLEKQLSRRKELEKELRLQKRTRPFSLSQNALSLTGYLMNEDEICAKFENGVLLFIHEESAPIYICRTHNIANYLASRTLDLNRPNARFLLKQLGIDKNKEAYAALYSYAACMQDHFWFKPLGSKKKYSDIAFDSDFYADAALSGKILQLKNFGSPSPEFTNIGSFEKCWKKIDGEWWLYKAGNRDEILSEYFVYLLSKILGIPTATYELDGDYIRTRNFAVEENFEPMYALLDDDENYHDVFHALLPLGRNIAEDYLRLLWLDAIVYNVDRHNQNYGLMRNRKTGEILSLAPNFDNNLALLAYNKTLDQKPEKDGLISLFLTFLSKEGEAKAIFREMPLPVLEERQLDEILSSMPPLPISPKRFVMDRYLYLKKWKDNL